MKNNVAIIGYGYVGKAMHKIFPDALVYDPLFWNGDKHTMLGMEAVLNNVDVSNKERINAVCELAIVCVPTPMQDNPTAEFQKVDLTIIDDTIAWLNTPLILIKSTVPPGTTAALNGKYPGKGICFSPEYIGEGKYQITPWKYMSPDDPRTHEFMIIGGAAEPREKIYNIFVRKLGPEKQYYLIDSIEAEIVKYTENAWGGVKVIFFQEIYELCQQLGASYARVREGWALDNRVERMHTAVFVDSRGFGGKCYPKDLNGIVAAAADIGVDLSMIKAALRKNKEIKTEDEGEGPAMYP